MWNAYTRDSLRQNRASGASIMAAALIAALFLSLLCSLFYNLWVYDIEQIVLNEGAWQGRITGEWEEADLALLRGLPNVKSAEPSGAPSEDGSAPVDLTFRNARTIYRDMPLLLAELGLPESAASYHTLLLSRYLIHDPADPEPPLLLTFYLAVLALVCLSLLFILHAAFALSMDARVRQFGMLSSIGAAPGQIRACLMQEAAALCTLPILLGGLLGTGLSYGALKAVNELAGDIAGRHEAVFTAHPLVLAAALLAAYLTVLLSAWLPARRLSRLTPLEAIGNPGGAELKRQSRSPVLSLLFGIEGELAGNALKAGRRALRTAALSLTLSYLGFTVMLCFFTLSGISTRHTYFDRYQNAWDVMVTVQNVCVEDFAPAERLRSLPKAADCVAYQRAEALCLLPASAVSERVTGLGGLSALAGPTARAEGDAYLVPAPVVILDDAAFLAYCGQIGAKPGLTGAVVLNRIWNSAESGYRYRTYVPYVTENLREITLETAGRESRAALPVLALAEEAPVLREAYEDYGLVLFLPASLWKSAAGLMGRATPDTYVRVLAENRDDLAALDGLEARVVASIGPGYALKSENRLREKLENDRLVRGSQFLLGTFCGLLALIGVTSVCTSTMGFVRQRRREFAQYLSIGMTPGEMRRMFCIEALTVAGRPLLIALPIAALSVAWMISASRLEPAEFWGEAPLLPILLFGAAIFVSVGLAYYLGGRRVLADRPADALRNETL